MSMLNPEKATFTATDPRTGQSYTFEDAEKVGDLYIHPRLPLDTPGYTVSNVKGVVIGHTRSLSHARAAAQIIQDAISSDQANWTATPLKRRSGPSKRGASAAISLAI
jgi:hypothetical protein